MNKIALFVFACALVMVFGMVSPAFAEVLTPSEYTITTGKLGEADYVLYMPQNWNGHLIIGCPGYNFYQNPQPELFFDTLAKSFASNGYAFAVSNYNGGERAWLLDEGIIRIHQLTKYLVGQYHVTGKIFLVGGSMGGGIALLLGEKYPMLYSGVLDICGTKGTPAQYEYGVFIATHSIAEIRELINPPSTVTDSQLEGLKTFFQTILADRIEQNHGTMDERPEEYAKENTLLHADIHIPVISVVGGIDRVVPIQVHMEYQAAVAAAGQSSLYRMYVVPGGGHLDAPVMAAVPEYLMELIAWSDTMQRTIPARVNIMPNVVSTESCCSIVVAVEMPKSYPLSAEKIIAVSLDNSISAKYCFSYGNLIIATFDSQSVRALLQGQHGRTQLTVAGSMSDGFVFQATDFVWVK